MLLKFTDHKKTLPARPSSRRLADLFNVGERLGDNHVILGVLGKGAMGCVYEAYDAQLDRYVAIKAAWPGIQPRHLHTEARVLAALRHPSLVSIHGMGTHRGIPYIVLERLRGQTLRAYLKSFSGRRAGSVEAILDILLAIAESLQYIHSHSVIHRDLKPANIMLTECGRVVLMDFGLLSNTEEDRRRIRGTPHYIAPEAVTDPAHCVSPALDIYALGVIAYQLLTGRPLFDGSDVMEILRKQVAEAIPAIDQQCRDISTHLCHLLTEMLAKDPRRRVSDASAVALWLRALLRSLRQHQRARTLSVLIADDDADMLGLLEACVEFAVPHAQIRTVKDGAQAWAMFAVEVPDVLIVDINMPRMGGVKLCDFLHRDDLLRNITVIPVTGLSDIRHNQELARLGIGAPIQKRQNCHDFLSGLSEKLIAANARRVHAPAPADVRPQGAARSVPPASLSATACYTIS